MKAGLRFVGMEDLFHTPGDRFYDVLIECSKDADNFDEWRCVGL